MTLHTYPEHTLPHKFRGSLRVPANIHDEPSQESETLVDIHYRLESNYETLNAEVISIKRALEPNRGRGRPPRDARTGGEGWGGVGETGGNQQGGGAKWREATPTTSLRSSRQMSMAAPTPERDDRATYVQKR